MIDATYLFPFLGINGNKNINLSRMAVLVIRLMCTYADTFNHLPLIQIGLHEKWITF